MEEGQGIITYSLMQADGIKKEKQMIGELCKKHESYMIEQRREFHMYPEISLKEEQTSQRIKAQLSQMGIPYEELPPNHSLVATIQGGKEGGKVIGIRADIDALPMQEESDIPYKSKTDGVMHACGHDAHVAMLLGAAKVLMECREDLAGTVKLIFQSAEEIGLGYQEILEYLERTGGIDQVIGLHIWSTLPEGEILLIPGSVFAGGSVFHITVKGQGGHGARPDLIREPIKAACDMVLKLAAIPSNMYDVLDYSVVSIGKIESGTMGNIFPDTVAIDGTTRFFKPEGGDKLIEHIRRIGAGVGTAYDVEVECEVSVSNPPVYNQPDLITHARELVDGIEGLKVSPQQEPICAGDNFSRILQRYPGFYGVLGAENKEDGCSWPQHNAKFNIDESALRKGCEFIVSYVADYLR